MNDLNMCVRTGVDGTCWRAQTTARRARVGGLSKARPVAALGNGTRPRAAPSLPPSPHLCTRTPLPAPSPPHSDNQTPKHKWTSEEEAALKAGVEK